MVKYKLVHKDGSVSYRDTKEEKKELLALLKGRKKKKTKELGKASLEFTKVGVISSVGGSVTSKVGGTAAGYAGSGISRLTSFAPIMGTAAGAGIAVGMTKELLPKKKKRR